MDESALISLLIVDDHALFRDTLSSSLAQQPGIRVLGVASNAMEALEIVRSRKPDVILIDIDMPGLVVFEAARRLSTHHADSKVIFLSAFLLDRYVEQALDVGAMGYLLKKESLEEVTKAIRKVASGSAHFSEEVWERIIVTPKGLKYSGPRTSRLFTLSPREMEILSYVARGMSKKEIATTTSLSPKTVETHIVHIMNKLKIHDRVKLATFAFNEGLVKD